MNHSGTISKVYSSTHVHFMVMLPLFGESINIHQLSLDLHVLFKVSCHLFTNHLSQWTFSCVVTTIESIKTVNNRFATAATTKFHPKKWKKRWERKHLYHLDHDLAIHTKNPGNGFILSCALLPLLQHRDSWSRAFKNSCLLLNITSSRKGSKMLFCCWVIWKPKAGKGEKATTTTSTIAANKNTQ